MNGSWDGPRMAKKNKQKTLLQTRERRKSKRYLPYVCILWSWALPCNVSPLAEVGGWGDGEVMFGEAEETPPPQVALEMGMGDKNIQP